jgi:hypothetical protein
MNNVIHIIRFTARKWAKYLVPVLATQDDKFLVTEDDKFIEL